MTAPDPAAPAPRRAVAAAYGLLCHGLFALGVGTMIAAMYFGMSRCLGRVPAPWSAAANALLLVQLPLAHSALLSRRGAGVLARLAPAGLGPPLATTSYAIVASVQVFLLFAFWTPSGVLWWQAQGATLWIVTALYAAAWLLLLKAICDAGIALQTGALGWWALFRDRAPAFPPMPATGLFRIVRQPIYVAFALTTWTTPTWTPDQFVVAVALTGYCVAGPRLKERRFRARFGAAFAAYARRVPYWLPWLPPATARNDLSIYDAAADWWDGETRWLRTLRNLAPARLAYFDPIVGDWSGRRVLDLGCGGGFMAQALADRGARVTGVDPSAGAIAAARRQAASTGRDIAYVVAPGERLPFRGAAFDIVVCVDVLEHVDDMPRVIAEIRRILAPEGLFLFDTINRTSIAAFVMVTLGERVIRLLPPGAHDPARFVRPGDLRRVLERAGFRVGGFAGLGPRGLDRRGDITFGRLPTTAAQYLGHARAPA